MRKKFLLITGGILLSLILITAWYIYDLFFRSVIYDDYGMIPAGSEKLPVNSTEDDPYTKNLMRARDTQRKSIVSQVAFALLSYKTTNGLPAEFPTQETCVGTKFPCYDLTPLLVPTELKKIPINPDGTNENTGYSVRLEGDEIVVSTKGELDENIEVRK